MHGRWPGKGSWTAVTRKATAASECVKIRVRCVVISGWVSGVQKSVFLAVQVFLCIFALLGRIGCRGQHFQNPYEEFLECRESGCVSPAGGESGAHFAKDAPQHLPVNREVFASCLSASSEIVWKLSAGGRVIATQVSTERFH